MRQQVIYVQILFILKIIIKKTFYSRQLYAFNNIVLSLPRDKVSLFRACNSYSNIYVFEIKTANSLSN